LVYHFSPKPIRKANSIFLGISRSWPMFQDFFPAPSTAPAQVSPPGGIALLVLPGSVATLQCTAMPLTTVGHSPSLMSWWKEALDHHLHFPS
jgi:hypothetical protein